MDDEQNMTPPEVARRIASMFDTARHISGWETAGEPGGRWGQAKVCRIRPHRVLHVIGASEMAERLRAEYAAGTVAGWSLHPMPDTRTPLHYYRDAFRALDERGHLTGYKSLDRHGFVWAEEVRACPDDALRAVNGVGPGRLDRIRAALATDIAPMVEASSTMDTAATPETATPTHEADVTHARQAASRLRERAQNLRDRADELDDTAELLLRLAHRA
ncbi:hypothetical protein [Prauserella marina]|uniref:hypothetical protein n=1 Tax=Prauserella marina TaxID=530584 RepID=UPI00115F7B94|nr:hypothetical protein [Prauserella marina]